MEQTITDVNLFLRMTKRYWEFQDFSDATYLMRYPINRPRAVCKDGFSISIQASSHHYCRPRIDNTDFYSYVELGYPSEKEEVLMEYADNLNDNEEYRTVYPCVPVDIVNKILESHGGIITTINCGLPK